MIYFYIKPTYKIRKFCIYSLVKEKSVMNLLPLPLKHSSDPVLSARKREPISLPANKMNLISPEKENNAPDEPNPKARTLNRHFQIKLDSKNNLDTFNKINRVHYPDAQKNSSNLIDKGHLHRKLPKISNRMMTRYNLMNDIRLPHQDNDMRIYDPNMDYWHDHEDHAGHLHQFDYFQNFDKNGHRIIDAAKRVETVADPKLASARLHQTRDAYGGYDAEYPSERKYRVRMPGSLKPRLEYATPYVGTMRPFFHADPGLRLVAYPSRKYQKRRGRAGKPKSRAKSKSRSRSRRKKDDKRRSKRAKSGKKSQAKKSSLKKAKSKKRVRFKSDEPRKIKSKEMKRILKKAVKKEEKSTKKKIKRLMKNMELIQSNHKKMSAKLVRNRKKYQSKLKDLRNQLDARQSPSGKENGLIEQLKYNPKFDLLNREHLLNKHKFDDDEFKMVEKYKKLRDQMQKEFLKKNKNGFYGKGGRGAANGRRLGPAGRLLPLSQGDRQLRPGKATGLPVFAEHVRPVDPDEEL